MESSDRKEEQGYQVYEEEHTENDNQMKVYRWDGGAQPQLMASLSYPRRVLKMSLGLQHALMLTSDDQLFTIGSNSVGQLGLGDVVDRKCLTLHPYFEQLDAAYIAAGSRHSACITSGGQLYTWGDNSLGQCGVGPDPFFTTPVKVSVCSPSDLQICSCGGDHPSVIELVQVACGQAHTLTVSSNGQCWTWGQGCDYGLADDDDGDISRPLCVNELADQFVTQIDCGLQHNILVSYPRQDPNQNNDTTRHRRAKTDVNINNSKSATPTETKRKVSRSGSSSSITSPLSASPDMYAIDFALSSLKQQSDSSLDTTEEFIMVETKQRSSTFSDLMHRTTLVWTWGNNTYGQLGLGDKTAR